jgi:hypothetical protein
MGSEGVAHTLHFSPNSYYKLPHVVSVGLRPTWNYVVRKNQEMNFAWGPVVAPRLPMTSMQLGSMLLSLALVAPRLLGSDSAATAANPQTSEATAPSFVRQAIRESFRYDPGTYVRPTTPEHLSPALRAPQAASDPAVVLMPKFEVRSRPIDYGLPEAIARYKDPRPQINRKFGTGIYQKDFGKVRMTTSTIFYIPFFVGFSW